MISLSRIILFGNDLTGLKEFYQTHFNFELLEEISGEWVLLKTGTVELAFHRIGVEYRDHLPFKAESNTKIVFTLDKDLTEFRNQLKANGVQIGNIRSFDGVDFLCDGEDIEGNVFQLRAINK